VPDMLQQLSRPSLDLHARGSAAGALCGLALTWILGPLSGTEPVSYDLSFPPVTTIIDAAARHPLTVPTSSAGCGSPAVKFAFSEGKARGGSTVSGALSFEVGPSFSTGRGAVVSWLQAIGGELSVRRAGEERRWTVRQFNFLNQAARANWDGKTHKLSVFLPVVLSSDGRCDTHAFLVAQGALKGDKMVWNRISFRFTEMVAKAFPDSPPIEEILGLAHSGAAAETVP
jgi:hypothetical protein